MNGKEMDDRLIARIQSFTLDARRRLETEAAEQLEGIYGWLPDGGFGDPRTYPALRGLDEARETRRRLESYAAAEREVGFDARAARRKLVREAAFTWLNRFVALRMMEERGLLREAVSRLADSNAYKFWLVDGHDPDAMGLHESGETPENAMGEGPRNVAYRRFLLWQCGELSREVSVLFDPATLASRLCPRPNVLKALVAAMNAEELASAWRPGNEETIGWVYSSFNAEEKDATFAAFQKGQKVKPEQIAPATQVFSPKWVVRYLVENSLGRLWLELHPDSRLKELLSYLVPAQNTRHRSQKLAREITFLDPATGSMHFGLVAFDLFAEMYKEEIENAGRPGWAERPSVPSVDDIPAAIIAHNLHGIDLDLRAVQLSALTLFLRARTMNPKCVFTDRNLACANVEQLTGGRLEEFIRQTQFGHPIYERILRQLALALKDSGNMGSLLRPERVLEELIAEERRKADKALLLLPGFSPEQFETKAGLTEFFDILQEQILRYLDIFAKQSQENGPDPSHFAAEAAKGLRFFRLVQERYDVVATNPPYMSRRNQSPIMAAFLDSNYPSNKSDLYAAFIDRCTELAASGGKVAMITQQSFMFISSYEQMRADLRRESAIESMVHLGPKAFPAVTGEKVNTTAFVFRKVPDEKQREENAGVYFRLVRERDSEAKRLAFESALAALRAGQNHPLLYTCRQKDFDAIPGKPWVYWMPVNLRTRFKELDLLQNMAPAIHGTATYDNFRFLRYWWECGTRNICRDSSSWNNFVKIGKTNVPYMKGGTPKPWFGNQEFVLRLLHRGKELKEFLVTKRDKIRGDDYVFRKGVTWSDVSSKGFAARLSPGGFIHDVKGMTCFPKEEDIPFILGLLNSRFAKFVLAALNPTISNQVGDIERLPVPSEGSQKITKLVNECVELARQDSRESEITYDFVQPAVSPEAVSARKSILAEKEAEIDAEVSWLYALTEEDLAAIDRELSGAPAATEVDSAEEAAAEDEEGASFAALSSGDWARSWVSYAAGIVLGSFEIGMPDGLGRGDFTPEVTAGLKRLAAGDGILANDPGQPLDLAGRVWRALELMLGEGEARSRVGTALGEGDPLDALCGWFARFAGQPAASFWKCHFQLYRKRPVYWPLQSPKKEFTVWVFHERLTKDTLFHVRNNIVEPRLRMAEQQSGDLKPKAQSDRRARKEMERLLDFADDLREFSRRLKAIADRGYTPYIDDGVLLNASPLFEILPSWPETKKAWQELEAGKYDWAHQAMEYWPDRVREKCKTNRSFAIAHGIEGLCVASTPEVKNRGRRTRRRA
jgi:hypothetical protein